MIAEIITSQGKNSQYFFLLTCEKAGEICDAAEGENQYLCIFGGQNCFIVHPSDTAPARVAVALAIEFNGDRVVDCRAALSGASPVPWRSLEAEAAVNGSFLDGNRAAEAAAAAVKNAEPMTQNGYKIPLFRSLIEQQLTGIAQADSG